MNRLSVKQELHREYLKSSVWKKIRLAALKHYGAICSKCGEFGSDVHHKTYQRWGGNEKMEDLEILCRDCHVVLHKVERASRPSKKKRRKSIHVTALFRYLSKKQRDSLVDRFSCQTPNDIYLMILDAEKGSEVRKAALKISGADYCHGLPPRPKKKRRKRKSKARNTPPY